MTLPLRGAVSGECHRSDMLLRNALTVVHFSPVMRISDASGAGIGEFQEAIRKAYPIVELELEQVIRFSLDDSDAQPVVESLPVWRFFDDAKTFRLSLTRQTIAIETKAEGYRNRQNFAARSADIIQAIGRHFTPAKASRVGVRYINMTEDTDQEQLKALCNPRLISITGADDLVQADLAWQFLVDEGKLILRSGIVAPGSSYDPTVLDPVEVRSWYLDIDVLDDDQQDFVDEAISDRIKSQVERAHAIYRWAIESENV